MLRRQVDGEEWDREVKAMGDFLDDGSAAEPVDVFVGVGAAAGDDMEEGMDRGTRDLGRIWTAYHSLENL